MNLKLVQQSVKGLTIRYGYLNMICSTFFCTELAKTVLLLFVATKDKFEFLHLPDLINDVQFPSLICLSLQFSPYSDNVGPNRLHDIGP